MWSNSKFSGTTQMEMFTENLKSPRGKKVSTSEPFHDQNTTDIETGTNTFLSRKLSFSLLRIMAGSKDPLFRNLIHMYYSGFVRSNHPVDGLEQGAVRLNPHIMDHVHGHVLGESNAHQAS